MQTVIVDGQAFMADVAYESDVITVTVTGDNSLDGKTIEVALALKDGFGLNEKTQQPPVEERRGQIVVAPLDSNSPSFQIATWDCDIVGLTHSSLMPSEMFVQLTSFNGSLNDLQDGTCMFASSQLRSWNVDLPKLSDGSGMFLGAIFLRDFCADLHSLENGDQMFCQPSDADSETMCLSSFNPFGGGEPKEGVLRDGSHMFHGCKLDLESVERIAAWLPSGKRHGTNEWDGNWIDIGVGINVKDDSPDSRWTTAINIMKSKGWGIVVCVNGGNNQPLN